MSFLNKIFSGGVKGVVDSIGSVIDNVHTSKKEKLEGVHKIMTQIDNASIEHERQITERHANDMKSGNKLAQSIRPITLMTVSIIVFILSFTDGNLGEFTVKPPWVELYKNVWITIVMFYFGSRGLEKMSNKVNLNNIFTKKNK